MSKKLRFALGCFIAVAAVTWSIEVGAAARTFVATTGVDSNTATNCGPTAPCRTFNAALSVTDSGGEVVVLNSGGYGPAPVTITHSVTITAPAGVYAGISVGAGLDGIVMSAGSSNVVLRGLTIEGVINGAGASNGIVMLAGVTLNVEGCVINNFTVGTLTTPVSGAGIYMGTNAVLNISDTTLSNNFAGVWADGTSTTNVVNSKALNNQFGFLALPTAAGLTTELTVTDSTVANSSAGGISAYGNFITGSTGTARVEITRVVSTGNFYGFLSRYGSTLVVSGSSAVNDSWGFFNSGESGTVFISAGDNKESGIAFGNSGTITVTPSLLTN